ncbi:hypothetical protein PSPO01_14388 [Paraphaeosphaeria sporulosa]
MIGVWWVGGSDETEALVGYAPTVGGVQGCRSTKARRPLLSVQARSPAKTRDRPLAGYTTTKASFLRVQCERATLSSRRRQRVRRGTRAGCSYPTQSQRAWFQRGGGVSSHLALLQCRPVAASQTHSPQKTARCTVQCPLRSTMVASGRHALLDAFPAAPSGAGHSQFLPNHEHPERRDAASRCGETERHSRIEDRYGDWHPRTLLPELSCPRRCNRLVRASATVPAPVASSCPPDHGAALSACAIESHSETPCSAALPFTSLLLWGIGAGDVAVSLHSRLADVAFCRVAHDYGLSGARNAHRQSDAPSFADSPHLLPPIAIKHHQRCASHNLSLSVARLLHRISDPFVPCATPDHAPYKSAHKWHSTTATPSRHRFLHPVCFSDPAPKSERGPGVVLYPVRSFCSSLAGRRQASVSPGDAASHILTEVQHPISKAYVFRRNPFDEGIAKAHPTPTFILSTPPPPSPSKPNPQYAPYVISKAWGKPENLRPSVRSIIHGSSMGTRGSAGSGDQSEAGESLEDVGPFGEYEFEDETPELRLLMPKCAAERLHCGI